jgi:hypothetical protein
LKLTIWKRKNRKIIANFNILKTIDVPDWKLLRGHLQREGRLKKEDFIKIIDETNKIFRIYKFLFSLSKILRQRGKSNLFR